MRNRSRSLILIPGILAFLTPSLTQAEQEKHPGHERGGLQEIVVTAHPGARSRYAVTQGTSVLGGEEMERAMSATIGDSLDHLPGLSQTAYGQGASRPVIRGLGGDRLRLLVNGLGTFDASSTSPDHAVALDLSTADRVEVVRGPATLKYGANAIAGVINVIDSRVPRDIPLNNGVEGFARSSYGTNANEILNGGSLNAHLGGGIVAHIDGFFRDTGNFKAPGFLRSRALRAEEPLEAGETEPFRRAINSDLRAWGATGGVSYIGRNGFIGTSVSALNNQYGIPVEMEHVHEDEHDAHDTHDHHDDNALVRVDIEQIRADLIGEWNTPFWVFDQASVRFGFGDYDQTELEGTEIGTIFMNNEWEGRLDLTQMEYKGWTGTSGVHLRRRSFEAIGLEAFVPPNTTFQWGLYSYQSYETGRWHLDAGLRFDRQEARANTMNIARNFSGVSASLSASYDLGHGFLLGLSAFRTERAPNADELFSDGPHLATFIFEKGDLSLGEETIKGVDATMKKAGRRTSFALNAFYYSYDNYIFERFTGAVQDNLAVAQFSSTDARFYGIELEAEHIVWEQGEYALGINTVFDFVKAKDTIGKNPLPRIPPLSFTLGTSFESHWVDVDVSANYAMKQKKTAPFERATGDYVNLAASVTAHPFAQHDITFIIQGDNLLNETIRHHTSFLKDLVPAPGRTFRFTVRAGF